MPRLQAHGKQLQNEKLGIERAINYIANRHLQIVLREHSPTNCPPPLVSERMHTPRQALKGLVVKALPGWPGSHLSPLGVDQVPVKLTSAGVDIHLRSPQPSLSFPEVSAHPEEQYNRQSKIRNEEAFRSANVTADGRNGSVELCKVSIGAMSFKDVRKHT